MQTDEHDRRRKTWELFFLESDQKSEVIRKVVDEFGVTEETVKEDFEQMEDWLPKLNQSGRVEELSMLLELQRTRQRLREMAAEAQEQNDLKLELSIRKEILSAIKLDERLGREIDRDAPSDIEDLMDDYLDSNL